MSAIVDIIVPVFGTVAVGWALGRWLLTPEGLRGLTNVTFYALFPALLFRSMAKVRLEVLELDIIVVFFGTGLLLYFLLMPLGRMLGMKLGDQTVFALSGTFSNGVGIGIPFISYAFGEAGLVPLLMIISVNSLVMLTLSSFLLEIGAGGGTSRGRLLAKLGGAAIMMMKHPVIPSIFAGLAWAEVTALIPGLATPVVVDRVLQALALAAPPCGLIMAGASLAHVGVKDHWQPAVVVSLVKLIAMPMLVWASGRYLFTLDPLWLTVATLNAAMPAGANVYLVAQLYRTGVGLATNAVVISTAASVATLSIALLLLGVQAR
ncbi:MAG: AEC family transporter [Reyranella sp.]|nr:AEC family transporter [Reyranella sp.]